MKKILLSILLSLPLILSAQLKCGLELTSKQASKVFQYRSDLQDKLVSSRTVLTDNLITIPVKVYLISDEAGTYQYSYSDLFTQMCELNDHYNKVGFYFYLLPDIEVIKDDRFIQLDPKKPTFYQGDIMNWFGNLMMFHYHYGALNVYYTRGTGLCGMGPFPFMAPQMMGKTGILMEGNKQCSGPGSMTLAHELGHHFDLLHTFQGWDTKDTMQSEYVTRTPGIANCSFAGDGFCDTPADLLNFDCPYIGNDVDMKNMRYNPDVSLIMSYHADRCQNKFSNSEISHMRTVIQTDTARVHYLGHQINEFSKPTPGALLLPNHQEVVPYDNPVTFSWEPSANAQAYYLKIFDFGGNIKHEALIYDSTVYHYEFGYNNRGKSLYWTIAPINFHQPCLIYSDTQNFKIATKATSLINYETIKFKTYPNPTQFGQRLHIVADRLSDNSEQVQVKVVGINGQLIQSEAIQFNGNKAELNLDENIVPGLYFIYYETGNQVYQSKVMIQ